MRLFAAALVATLALSGAAAAQPANYVDPSQPRNTQSVVVTPLTPLPVGVTGTVAVTQTVTAGSAYTAGNAVGALLQLFGSARYLGAGGLVQSVLVESKSAQTTPMDLVLFAANPTASTCTDKTAFALSTNDYDKVVGVVHVTDWTSLGTPSVGQAQTLAVPFSSNLTTTLYGCLVTRSTPTFTATNDIIVALRVLQN